MLSHHNFGISADVSSLVPEILEHIIVVNDALTVHLVGHSVWKPVVPGEIPYFALFSLALITVPNDLREKFSSLRFLIKIFSANIFGRHYIIRAKFMDVVDIYSV